MSVPYAYLAFYDDVINKDKFLVINGDYRNPIIFTFRVANDMMIFALDTKLCSEISENSIIYLIHEYIKMTGNLEFCLPIFSFKGICVMSLYNTLTYHINEFLQKCKLDYDHLSYYKFKQLHPE